MSALTGDYAVCRERLLERLRESAPAQIQLLTWPRQVGKTTLLLEVAAQFGAGAVYAPEKSPMRRFLASGSGVGLRPKHELSAERRSIA
jgi:AAA+ ATPase superfamily predicted ATPase